VSDVEWIDPFSLPQTPLERKGELPDMSGIYFAIVDSEILYIGKSTDLQQRWQAHHRLKQLKSYGNVILAWCLLADLEEYDLDQLEAACIEYFKPLLNGMAMPPEFVKVGVKDKLIRNIPNEVVEELERRAKDMGMQFGTYVRLLLIHTATRQPRSMIKEWATATTRIPRDQERHEEGTASMTERDRYQLAVDAGTVDQYYEDLRREAFRRDEQRKEE